MAKTSWTAWAGFIDGHPDIEVEGATEDRYAKLYRLRREARKFYQDVRRVEIREVKQGTREVHGK